MEVFTGEGERMGDLLTVLQLGGEEDVGERGSTFVI